MRVATLALQAPLTLFLSHEGLTTQQFWGKGRNRRFFSSLPLVIVELDGGQHNERVVYDGKRSAWLESQGFRVLRFWNHEVLKNLEAVTDVILKACGRETPSPWPSPIKGEGT